MVLDAPAHLVSQACREIYQKRLPCDRKWLALSLNSVLGRIKILLARENRSDSETLELKVLLGRLLLEHTTGPKAKLFWILRYAPKTHTAIHRQLFAYYSVFGYQILEKLDSRIRQDV